MSTSCSPQNSLSHWRGTFKFKRQVTDVLTETVKRVKGTQRFFFFEMTIYRRVLNASCSHSHGRWLYSEMSLILITKVKIVQTMHFMCATKSHWVQYALKMWYITFCECYLVQWSKNQHSFSFKHYFYTLMAHVITLYFYSISPCNSF